MRNRKALLCLIVIAWTGFLAAGETLDLSTIWKIKDEGLSRSQVMNTLSYLSDVHGPRLTGSPGIKAAQRWAEKTLQEWGLVSVHLESYPFGKGWTLEHLSAEMLEPTYSPLIAFPKSWSQPTPGPVTGHAILAEIRSERDFDKYRGKLKGMFVLTQPLREMSMISNAPARRYTEEDLKQIALAPDPGARRNPPSEPRDPQFPRKLSEFYLEEGVAALLEPSPGSGGGTVFVVSAGRRSAEPLPSPPQLVVAAEHYNRMLRILEKQIKVQLRIDIQCRVQGEETDAFNLIGEIPGTEKRDEVVMLGAHFDSHHSGTGATDNAAGSAVAMEVMRILKAIDARPRRTIRLALWSGEEQGLLGSEAYVADHFASRPDSGRATSPEGGALSPSPDGPTAAQPRAPLSLKAEHSRLSVYFNLDNGGGKIRGIYLQGNEEVRSVFGAWLEPFRDMGATTTSIRNTGGTDHVSFDRVGLPGFQFIQDPLEYDSRTHHSNMDVYDRVQPSDMMQAAVVMASFVWQAAVREEMIPRKPLARNLVVAAGGRE